MLRHHLDPRTGAACRGRTLLAALAASAAVLGARPLAAQSSPTPAPVAPATSLQPASTQPTRTITFAEAVRTALEQNPTLRQARNTNALDATAVRQQRLQFLPDLRLSAQSAESYGRNFSETEGQIINQTTQSLNAGLSSSVVLFDGLGNVASLREATLQQDASEAEVARARQTAVFTVASNYLALVAQEEQLRVRREDLAAREVEERQIQAFVDAGTRPISDLYQQQANVASARLAVVEAERQLELAKVDLMQTLQLDPRGTYAFEAPAIAPAIAPAATTGERPTLDALLARAAAGRADLAAGETRQAAAEQGVRAARASYWPTISLTGGYNSGYTSATSFPFWDQLDQRRGGSLGIGVSIPLFDRASTGTATERARIEADNARIALDARRNEVGLEVRRAYVGYQAAEAQLQAAGAQQRAAELALSASQDRYRVGAATLVEVTQARASQVQAASALVSARYNLVLQRTLMAYAVGDLDPELRALS